MKKSYLKKVLPLFGIVLLSVPLILPYFRQGYFPTHDGEWAVVRAVEMFREVRDMQFPPRYSGTLNFTYGYPLFNFAYPFPYYLTIILHAIGFSFLGSVKFLFAISIPLSAVSMYLLTAKIWKNSLAGIIASILYIYVPYRMIDLYVRGSIGESISFVLYPLIAYLLYRFVVEQRLYSGVLAGVLFAILITTHNIMAVYFLLLLGIFSLAAIMVRSLKFLKPFIFFGVLGMGLSAYFWIPALFEKQYILLSKVPIADRDLYYPTLQQLFIPAWGYGTPTSVDGFSYQLGIPIILILIMFIGHTIYSLFITHRLDKKLAYIFGSSGILFIMLFPVSRNVWENVPLLSEINYPWTLLGPISFLAAVGVGWFVLNKHTKYLSIAIAALAIVVVMPYAKPEKYIERTDDFYISNDATTTSSNELMPLWVKSHPQQRPEEKVKGNGIDVSDETFISNKFHFQVTSPREQQITINRIFYPGWKITINNGNVPIQYRNNQGLMQVTIPSGESQVNGQFSETPMRIVADIISMLSILSILVILMKKNVTEKILFKKHEK
jgi:hypothetical protein